MTLVGLVVNPGASRDVRRLTSLARTVDAVEQANAVARALCGMAASGVARVLYMPEPTQVVRRAAEMLAGTRGAPARMPELVPVAIPGDGYAKNAEGTAGAAVAIRAAGATAVLTIGGDGTNRAVAMGWPEAVFLPLPGGTNNAFCQRIDPTAAGQAIGLYARHPTHFEADVVRHPYLQLKLGDHTTVALVDIALVRAGWVGAHAIWEPEALAEAIVSRSDPTVPGLAGVAGAVRPLPAGTPHGVHLVFDPRGHRIQGQLGPGQVVELGLQAATVFGAGDWILMPTAPAASHDALTLAFDGEREIVLEAGDQAVVHLVLPGVQVLDGSAVLRRAARDDLLAPMVPAAASG